MTECYGAIKLPTANLYREAMDQFPGVVWCNDPATAVKDADAMVVLTEWEDYRRLDLLSVAKLMRRNLIIDLRNIYDPAMMNKLPFEYHSLGRAPVLPAADPRWIPSAQELANVLRLHGASGQTAAWAGEVPESRRA